MSPQRRLRRPLATPGTWREGNAIELLENGEEFFPRVFDAIDRAREEILLETFILFEDKVGIELQQRLVAAARRGVQVDLTADGWGSPDFSPDYLAQMSAAGVRFHLFDPHPRRFGLRLHLFRRMHRKIAVIDGERAFIGGINFSVEHLREHGPKALQDFAVELRGPVVGDIHRFALAQLARPVRRVQPRAEAGAATVLFATRDNARCRTDIERHYRAAIRAARHRVTIANAYFFPSHRLLSELRRAARRGVQVRLILQGEPDERIAMLGARALYRHLIRAGVQVFEYGLRPFHGKVALIDDDWATVGSSNLDPLSLSLNLEANVFVRDRAFNACLGARLDALRDAHCRRITLDALPHGTLWQALTGPIAF
ncbi:MAG TPA: cardiolipin synthase ClsB, partial [Lysobacter sp.]